jgi:hypothetical protein
MTELANLMVWIGTIVTIAAGLGSAIIFAALLRGKDQEYRRKREEFLQMKKDVESRLNESRLREHR